MLLCGARSISLIQGPAPFLFDMAIWFGIFGLIPFFLRLVLVVFPTLPRTTHLAHPWKVLGSKQPSREHGHSLLLCQSLKIWMIRMVKVSSQCLKRSKVLKGLISNSNIEHDRIWSWYVVTCAILCFNRLLEEWLRHLRTRKERPYLHHTSLQTISLFSKPGELYIYNT